VLELGYNAKWHDIQQLYKDVIDPQILKLAIHYTQRAKVGDDTWTVVDPHESVVFTHENGRRVSLFFYLNLC
jgi:hypothetical protein